VLLALVALELLVVVLAVVSSPLHAANESAASVHKNPIVRIGISPRFKMPPGEPERAAWPSAQARAV
jgi:hypothetical protein